MSKNKSKEEVFEKNTEFVERVLLLSVPSAIVFIILVAIKVLAAPMAIMSYSAIISFNIVLLFPITFELQRLKNYIASLASEEDIDVKDMMLSEQEAKEIATAINQVHQFWVKKNDALTAQTMSDAAVLDTLPDPIMIINKKQDIVGANISAMNLFGEEIKGKNVADVIENESVKKAVTSVVSRQTDSENLVFHLNEVDHRKMYAHIKQLPWFSTGQSEAVISLYDLSKVTKLEKIQSDFVANASHELRTPLSIISGFIETLQTTAHDDPHASEMFLPIMKDQADYMSTLIENLLSLSRIEMSDSDKPKDKVDFIEIIYDVRNSLFLKMKNKNMNLKVVQNSDEAQAVADYSQMKQVMHNLVDNAIKYGDEGTDIVVTVDTEEKIPPALEFEVAEGKALSISINNKGEVIKKENIERLTERFYRLQTHRDKNIKGTGLGLSIVKHIIMRHMGNLEISSTKRKGTTFKVYIPMN